ncbi:hypothetical protein [Pectinatus sottacetonis]|uniref:hypothetical protein n=1 Tax=Pectinatus sottacetonis TaxID=1002795 RepID=UPI0018C783DE|nr:hypothetical protein [Pectinatus sottacetonis]
MARAFAAAETVPTDIYEWVQASPRISYYFNKKEMKYVVGDDGIVNTDILEVPVLEQYDWIEIQDVIQKRRWNNEDVSTLGGIWGAEAILHIDTKKRTVAYLQQSYLDANWNSILDITSNRVDNIDKMSDKNLDRNFYQAIIDYAEKNKQELIKRQQGKISPANLQEDTKDKLKKNLKTEKQKVKEIIKLYGNK